MSGSNVTTRTPVAVLGATGLVGQRLVSLLAGHPWFELVEVAASTRSAGRPYAEAVSWQLPGPVPEPARSLEVLPADPRRVRAPLVFSALDAAAAAEVEHRFSADGRLVVSNARTHRMAPRVPLVVPEVNPDHLAALEEQRGSGGIVTNPNCSVIALVLPLAPIHERWGVRRMVVTTLQAASGAGYPGVPSLELVDNVVPEIPGEEEKIEREPRKILGAWEGGRFREAEVVVSAATHRVPVRDGHLLAVSIETDRPADPAEVAATLAGFRREGVTGVLPSAPDPPIVVTDAPGRPQPRLDREAGAGMAVTVGRIRPCPVLGLRLEALGHNTIRGAAGGTLLLAELLRSRGLLP